MVSADLAIDVFLGKNLLSLSFIFSAALCPGALLPLFILALLLLDGVEMTRWLFSSLLLSSLLTFCPFRILNKSARERGLKVVVVVIFLVGRVRILNKLNLVVDSVVEGEVVFPLLLIIAQGSNADCNLSKASCILAWLDEDELDEEVDEREVETLTLTLGCSLPDFDSLEIVDIEETEVDRFVVVDERLVTFSLSLSAGSDVGRNPTEELDGGFEVVLANEEDVLRGVVTRNCGEIVGIKGGRGVLFRRLSSIKSVSINPLKFCLARSFCRLITVIALPSSSSGSLLTPSSDGTSANGIMLLSSCSSSNGMELVGEENFDCPLPPVKPNWSSCSTALT